MFSLRFFAHPQSFCVLLLFTVSLTASADEDLAAKQVARAKQVPLNDLRQAFVAYWKKNNPDNKPGGILTYDGNHFNQKGMDFVAEQMLGKFK